jgi:hypothetical protein
MAIQALQALFREHIVVSVRAFHKFGHEYRDAFPPFLADLLYCNFLAATTP